MPDNIGPAREEGSAMYIFVSTYSATEFVKSYLYSLYLKNTGLHLFLTTIYHLLVFPSHSALPPPSSQTSL